MPRFVINGAKKTAPGFTFNGMDVDGGLGRNILDRCYFDFVDLGVFMFVADAIKAARHLQKECDDRAGGMIYDEFGENWEAHVKEFGCPDYVSALCIVKDDKFVSVEL